MMGGFRRSAHPGGARSRRDSARSHDHNVEVTGVEVTDGDTSDIDASACNFAMAGVSATDLHNSDAAPPEKERPDAYRKALGLLVRREHSRRELKRKLDAKGADPADAERALDTLTGQGYQNDARFAQMLARTRIGGGYGPIRIRSELGMHDIGEDVIAQVLDESHADWPALAIDALRRRYGARVATDAAERIKRSNYLMRRGFDGDSIRAAVAHRFED